MFASCGELAGFIEKVDNPSPHRLAALVHVPLGPSDYIGVCPNIETTSNGLSRFRHHLLHRRDVFIKTREGSGDKESIMHRGADLDFRFRACNRRDPHHFGSVCLHRKIHQ
jgi:hypothetical protein